ncbi:MAG: ribose-phosphate pyrophosphokinae [Candidatus Methanomethylophilaceae archaeon]|nr:MAG: Ribose-phosphate pyrophosphokinase [Thermoplasmatales archaeon 49_6]MDI3482927.1 ribose-phosphate pyrophosphokinae [Candidatus Methanomethylophilaceae archaeon]MDI3541194.1 ribose-phosphate pyrophosphokinae [Candidatus Methanomethylophilaceae archaeon]HIJ00141.1 ribose-phosphate diphosphokinase [Candidatus Methanomethylophilaceae archaeon]
MIVVGGSSSRDMSKELAMILECKYVQAATTRFPDGECYTRIEDDLMDDHVIIVQNTYPDENIIEMFLLQDAVKRLGAKSITCVIPYYGYARQDRIFKPGEPESAKVMAQRLELLCDRVITVDIHKEAVLRWFHCPAKDVKAAPAIGKYFQGRGIDLVLAPDIGASERAKMIANYIGAPYDHMEKVRISGTEVRISPAEIDCRGKSVLIVDDIISTGGTILAACEELHKQGAASISVACTHGVFANNALKRLTGSTVDSLLCCNTLENEVSNISVAPLVAEAIKEW